MTLSKDIKAASSIPLILSILSEGDSYGYEIIKKVKECSNEKIMWKEGSLYPVLTKLEKNGYVDSYTKQVDGRNRKYYTIKKEGSSYLKILKEEWIFINQIMTNLWKGQILPQRN